MPSTYIKKIINDTAKKCALAAIPGSIVPGIDMAAVGGLWTYMMVKISEEHRVRFEDAPLQFAGTVAAGVGSYWTGSKLFAWGIGTVFALFTFGIGLFMVPMMNVALNGYFTWAVGRRMDAIFASNSNSEAGKEIAMQIIRAVCHVPSRSEFSEFLDDTNMSLREIKGWFD